MIPIAAEGGGRSKEKMMTVDELSILLTGVVIGFAAAAAMIVITYIVLCIKETQDELQRRKEHRMENLMMAEAERGLEERE